MRPFDIAHDCPRIGLRVGIIQTFDLTEVTRAVVFAAEVERQPAILAACRDQLLAVVEVALGQPVLFKDVAPATSPRIEIEPWLDFKQALAPCLNASIIRGATLGGDAATADTFGQGKIDSVDHLANRLRLVAAGCVAQAPGLRVGLPFQNVGLAVGGLARADPDAFGKESARFHAPTRQVMEARDCVDFGGK
jgi:hypothetical protein